MHILLLILITKVKETELDLALELFSTSITHASKNSLLCKDSNTSWGVFVKGKSQCRVGVGEMGDSYTPFRLLIVVSAVVLTPWPRCSVSLSCAACLIVYGREAHLCA